MFLRDSCTACTANIVHVKIISQMTFQLGFLTLLIRAFYEGARPMRYCFHLWLALQVLTFQCFQRKYFSFPHMTYLLNIYFKVSQLTFLSRNFFIVLFSIHKKFIMYLSKEKFDNTFIKYNYANLLRRRS